MNKKLKRLNKLSLNNTNYFKEFVPPSIQKKRQKQFQYQQYCTNYLVGKYNTLVNLIHEYNNKKYYKEYKQFLKHVFAFYSVYQSVIFRLFLRQHMKPYESLKLSKTEVKNLCTSVLDTDPIMLKYYMKLYEK